MDFDVDYLELDNLDYDYLDFDSNNLGHIDNIGLDNNWVEGRLDYYLYQLYLYFDKDSENYFTHSNLREKKYKMIQRLEYLL